MQDQVTCPVLIWLTSTFLASMKQLHATHYNVAKHKTEVTAS